MSFKYYKDVPTTSYIWFKLLDQNNKVVEDYPDSACYGVIAHGFDKTAQRIHIYHEKNKVPYDVACIKRWIADLNEMGFPCSFVDGETPNDLPKPEEFVKETINSGLTDMALSLMRHGVKPPRNPGDFYNFFVDLKKYEDKNHFFSTLSLIRCLTESGICKVPEIYFDLIDNHAMDKFEACQVAHKKITAKNRRYDPKEYANVGHMVTFEGNGENITKEALMAKFQKAKINLRDDGHLQINASWNGSK